jgi:hypothetical protein
MQLILSSACLETDGQSLKGWRMTCGYSIYEGIIFTRSWLQICFDVPFLKADSFVGPRGISDKSFFAAAQTNADYEESSQICLVAPLLEADSRPLFDSSRKDYTSRRDLLIGSWLSVGPRGTASTLSVTDNFSPSLKISATPARDSACWPHNAPPFDSSRT